MIDRLDLFISYPNVELDRFLSFKNVDFFVLLTNGHFVHGVDELVVVAEALGVVGGLVQSPKSSQLFEYISTVEIVNTPRTTARKAKDHERKDKHVFRLGPKKNN